MFIDTHAHLNFNAFKDDANEVIKKCLDNDIWLINIGTNYETSKKAVEIAEKYPQGVYASVGLHPINLETGLVKIKTDENEGGRLEKEFDYEKYKKLVLNSKKIVAIGEIGFDYWRGPKTKRKSELLKEKQRSVLCQQLSLAKELNLPVIFHCRLAHDDLLDVFNQPLTISNQQLRGVIHCFTGNWEQAKKYLEMGFYLGFNGIIFKLNLDEIIRKTPLDRILIETDCPYLTPSSFPAQREVSFRFDSLSSERSELGEMNTKYSLSPSGVREERNNPLGVKYVAEKIAKIKGISFEEMAEITTRNAKRLFNIYHCP